MVQITVAIISVCITPKRTQACLIRFSILPNMRTSDIGKSIMATVWSQLMRPVGFS